MRRLLRYLTGWLDNSSGKRPVERDIESRNAEDFARLNEEAPLHGAQDSPKAIMRRETVLDRSEKIAGYEFSLLTSLQARLLRRGGMAKRTYDGWLLSRLALNGAPSLLGHRLAFVNLSTDSLSSALIEQLPPENTVLMLESNEQGSDWAEVAARIAELKQKGFYCGLRIRDASDTQWPLIDDLEFFQIDVTSFDGIDLRALSGELRKKQPAEAAPRRLLARDVQSHDEFQFCVKCGFDLFQGPFISSRESLRPTSGGINRMAILPILNGVRNDQSFAKIAEQLKNEPNLSYKLLRYLNSAAMGLQQPIDNLTQALVLIGREKFYRWMSLLLFDFANPSYRERSLAESALARGRTLELLAGKGQIPNVPDHLFLIGLFSLLDVALGRPLPELLEEARLPDAVRDALLGVAGAFADALVLAVLGGADTTTSPEQMSAALERCGIADTDYTPAAAAALVWANQTLSEAA